MDARKNTRQHQKKKKDALPDYCAAKHADGVCALKRNKHIFFLCVIIKFPLKSHFFNSLIPLPHFDLYKCPTRITAVLTHFSAAPMNYLLRLPSPTAPPFILTHTGAQTALSDFLDAESNLFCSSDGPSACASNLPTTCCHSEAEAPPQTAPSSSLAS